MMPVMDYNVLNIFKWKNYNAMSLSRNLWLCFKSYDADFHLFKLKEHNSRCSAVFAFIKSRFDDSIGGVRIRFIFCVY